MKILTVEDDNMIREGISEYLSEFGYTVIQAKDGREALSKFNSGLSDVLSSEADQVGQRLEQDAERASLRPFLFLYTI